ncbi:MAG: WecB/TagA/CpsF family glycosyltransferase [bacterium]
MKKTKRVRILSLELDPITQQELRRTIGAWLTGPRQSTRIIVKPYVEFFLSAETDETLRRAINQADQVVADGISAQWAGAYLSQSHHGLWFWLKSLIFDLRDPAWLASALPERGAGVDSTHALLVEAAQHGWQVGILGGPHDITRTKHAVQERYPLLQFSHIWSGYYKSQKVADLIKSIKQAKLDILFVALGHPKQELFMAHHKSDNLARIMIGEGGTFDYDQMGGTIKRAPSWLRHIGLEWIWRFVMQPSRFKRQLAVPRFMWQIYLEGQKKKKR